MTREQLQAVEKVRNETLVSESGDKVIVIAQRLRELGGIGAETATVLAREASIGGSTTAASSPSSPDSPRPPMRAERGNANRVSRRPAMPGYATCASSSPGSGCATSRKAGWRSGIVREPALDRERGRSVSSLSHASCSSRCGALLKTGWCRTARGCAPIDGQRLILSRSNAELPLCPTARRKLPGSTTQHKGRYRIILRGAGRSAIRQL